MYLETIQTDNHDWCFVSGMTNALESGMFTFDYYEKLLNAKTIDGFLKYITNSKLKDYFTTKQAIYDYENSIDNCFFENIREIRTLSPSGIVCDVFLLKYKFLELKNLIKNRIYGVTPEHITAFLSGGLNIENLFSDKENTNNIMFNELLPDIKDIVLNNVKNLIKLFKENRGLYKNINLWIVDLSMDNAYLCSLSKISKQISIHCIEEYMEKSIFVNVIKSLLRATLSGCNIELFKKYFLQGYLHLNYFLRLADSPFNEWESILKRELPAEIVREISLDKNETKKNNINLTRCERLLDNYLIDIIKPVKNIAFGSERIFGYLCGLEVEKYNLKLIIGGKINNIEKQLLKERMRNCYV